ncbi:DUF1345 domain-containing protein [Georgenia sp. TF02-10]|uniref:DUF1345 domain-containing protein n=1 Tax=Georgenia sp. TF02-10 TaxID=2917725 RepID=UPI001FA70930|nr:DUF1345 domain-containing protein [Georgenia sp. TF02-10]UNX53710.1 DUF1345 domain-containing protein [Georgenia sp. TF02-10]
MTRRPRWPLSSGGQVLLSVVVGVAVGALAVRLVEPPLWLLLAWDATAATYITLVWSVSWPRDAAGTRALARREDPSRNAVAAVMVVAAATGFAAATYALLGSSSADTGTRRLTIGLGVASVVLSWVLVNTVFALHYAHMYYDDKPEGGLDFNQDEPPRYSDFAYVAFTVGVTSAMPDVNLQDSGIRRVVLGHTLLSFLFAGGLLAIVISLVPSVVG